MTRDNGDLTEANMLRDIDHWSADRASPFDRPDLRACTPHVRNRILERAQAMARRNPVPEPTPRGCAIALMFAAALVLWGLGALIWRLFT